MLCLQRACLRRGPVAALNPLAGERAGQVVSPSRQAVEDLAAGNVGRGWVRVCVCVCLCICTRRNNYLVCRYCTE